MNKNEKTIRALIEQAVGLKVDEYERALELYDSALMIDPDDWMTYKCKADTCLDCGKYDMAIECAEKALELTDNERIEEIATIKILAFESSDRYDEGLEWVDKKLVEYVDDETVDDFKSIILYDKYKKYGGLELAETAINFYDDAIQRTPNNFGILNSKGEILTDLERYSEALMCFSNVIARYPDNDRAMLGKANVLYKMGQDKKAIKFCKKLIKLCSMDPQIQTKLFLLLADLNQVQDMNYPLDMLIDWDPDEPKYRIIKNKLEEEISSKEGSNKLIDCTKFKRLLNNP